MQKYASAVARVVSCYGVLADCSPTMWREIAKHGIEPWSQAAMTAPVPMAFDDVLTVWDTWLPRLVALARACFLPHKTRLSLAFTPLPINVNGEIRYLRSALWAPVPVVTADNCPAIKIRRFGFQLTSFKTLARVLKVEDNAELRQCRSQKWRWASFAPEV